MEIGLVGLWLVTYLGLLVIGMTITSVVLPQLDDKGAGVAIPMALAIVWVVTYFLGQFSIELGLWVGLALLAVFAVIARRHGAEIDRSIYLETAAVFSVAFVFLISIRATDPAVYPGGGEKFLDYGLLRSLLRSTTIPPEDVWFAGEPVNYYYGGHLLASLLARMTNTAGRFAYNLAHAGFYAMLVTATFGLARSIAGGRDLPARSAGFLAAFFVGIASNLLPAAQVLLLALPGSISDALRSTLGVDGGGLSNGLSKFSYWTASRVIPDTINEFPLFAWLNGDMHAHMMSTPFLLLGAAILFGYYQTPAEHRGRRLALLGSLGPLAAMLTVVNTWSFPSIGGLTVLTVAMAPAAPQTLFPSALRRRLDWNGWIRQEVRRHSLAIVIGVLVLAVGASLSLPFWLEAASGQRGIGLFPERSAIGVLFLVHGAFLTVFALYYARYGMPHISNSRVYVLALAVIVAIAGLTDLAAVGLFVPVLLVGWVLTRCADYDAVPAPGYESVLILGGLGLAILVEFVFVQEQAGPGRMNTVFKVYMQVWILWATAMGVALVGLFADRRPSLGLDGPAWRRRFRVLAVVLIVSTSIYGVLAMNEHFRERTTTDEATLDGIAFLETDHPNEAPAIHYLDERVAGQPTMVSKPGTDIYQWVNGPASLSGVPTVAGWIHEVGYRGPEAYLDRVEDVDTIFAGPPERQRELLAKYDVEYAYVGPLEREAYPDLSIHELDAVTVEQSWEDVTLYQIDQSALER